MKSVHFDSQVAGMPCQNNHFWLDFGYRGVWQPCTEKRSDEHLGTTTKKLKYNINRVGGALNGTVNEHRLNLEDEQQNASNVLNVLKESTFQMENRISEEVAKKRAVKFYMLHANFHLSTDVTFLTNPPAVLSTDTIEVYDSSDIRDALNSIYSGALRHSMGHFRLKLEALYFLFI